MSCHLCHFPGGYHESIREKLYLLKFAAKLLCGPPCFLLVHLMNFFIANGPLFLLQYRKISSSLVKAYSGPHRYVQNFVRPSNMLCLFIEIYWSVIEGILKYYCRQFNCDFEEISNKYYSPKCFHLNRWENGKCVLVHQRNIIEVQNPVEILIQTQNYSFLSKNSYLFLVTQSLMIVLEISQITSSFFIRLGRYSTGNTAFQTESTGII